MDLFSIITILVVVSAAFAYINERFFKAALYHRSDGDCYPDEYGTDDYRLD